LNDTRIDTGEGVARDALAFAVPLTVSSECNRPTPAEFSVARV